MLKLKNVKKFGNFTKILYLCGQISKHRVITINGATKQNDLEYNQPMKTTTANTTIIDGYVQLLENLSPSNKLDLIAKLTASIKIDLTNRKTSFKKAFGAFESTKSAEEIIDEIRNSRHTKPIIC